MARMRTLWAIAALLVLVSASLLAQEEAFVRRATIGNPIVSVGWGEAFGGVDFDGDGKIEIYAVNSNYYDAVDDELLPHIYKYELDNGAWSVVWQAVIADQWQNTWPALTYGDWDKDGKWELIWGPVNNLSNTPPFSANPFRVLVYEAKGDGSDEMGINDGLGGFNPNAKWTITPDDDVNLRPFKWELHDIDGDGTDELIFCDRAGTTDAFFKFGILSVNNIPDNGDGSETWTLEYSAAGVAHAGGTVYDFAVIGNTVWFITSNGSVQDVTYTGGAYVLGAPQAGLVPGGSWKSAEVADIDADGNKEIIVGGNGAGGAANSVYVLVPTGTTLAASAVATFDLGTGRIFGGGQGDVDSDGKLDFIYGSRSSTPVPGVVTRLKYLGGSITDPASYEASVIDQGVNLNGGRWDIMDLFSFDADTDDEVLYGLGYGDLAGETPLVLLDRTFVNPVTFEVNMSVKMQEGKFDVPAGDVVTVAGNFNGWAAAKDTLTDPESDSVYSGTVKIEAGDINYKFVKYNAGNTDWEGDPNRTYTVVAGPQTIPVDYFDRDTEINRTAPVTFQVHMGVKMQEGTFDPATDRAVVSGGFNGWSTTADTLSDPEADSVYTGTITDKLFEGTYYEYKFVKVRTASTDWEDNIGGNRNLTVPVGGTTLDVVYFDNDNQVNFPTSGNILHTLDMTAYLNLGWFRPDLGDSIQLRGAWAPLTWDGNAPRLDPVGGSPGKYELLQAYTGFTFDQFGMKYFMDLDTTSAPTRFPTYTDFADGVQYEHPSERGDGNRVFNVGPGGDIIAPDVYYSDIDPRGTLAESDIVSVTLSVDMTPATAFSVPFDAGTDTLFLVWQDQLWRGSQITSQGSFPQTWVMSQVGSSNEYTVTFTVKGPTHYNMQYTYRYSDVASGSSVETGTGLGQQNPYYTRFIDPLGPNTWPASYSAPIDTWKKNAPLPGELAPDFTTDVNDHANQPYVFELRQNYPNPFNPSTTIRFSIPEQSQVSLRIYNTLGQEVARVVDGVLPAGSHTASFDARSLATGVYFYELKAGKSTDIKKMMLLK